MNDTSYKLRSELLSMAKDICEYNIFMQRNGIELALDAARNTPTLTSPYDNAKDHAAAIAKQDAEVKALLDRYNNIEHMSINVVLAYARQMNDFISDNGTKTSE